MNSNLLTSITENKPSVRLIDQILRLGEDEFYTIAARRLNLPLSESKIKELRITDQDKREYYTEEYLVDKLSIELAATKDNIVMNDGKLVSVRKYYNQALRIGKYIPVARPVPEFIINISEGRNDSWSEKIVPMKYVDRIVAMFAPNVIGHNDKKIGILRSILGSRTDHGNDNGRRGRINTLLVGDPGTAKTLLAREATKILPNSKFVTAQNASGKSLVAIVDKENDSLVLRLGAAVLSKGAICAINELGSMSMDDQQHLIDIAEEGRCTVDKYGMHFEIDSPTTIIATSNPYSGTWNKTASISKEEIPTLRTFLDRCDQVYGFRDAPSDEEVVEYSRQKTSIRKRKPHNYNFLRKLLIHMKSGINPKMTYDTEERLNEFWIDAKIQGMVTNRAYDSIFRLAEAQARLNLCNEINDEITTQTMKSMSLMLSQYGHIVEIIESPRDFAYRAFYHTLKKIKAGLSVRELCKIACQQYEQVEEYLGHNFDMEHNRKIKPVIDMLLNNHSENIRIISMKPMVLQYVDIEETNRKFHHLSDLSDVSYTTNQKHEDNNMNKIEPSASGKYKGIDASDMGTYATIPRPGGVLYGEGQGVIMTSDSGEMATWIGQGIAHFIGPGKVRFHGSLFYRTPSSTTGKLSALNNLVGVFEYETDEMGNTSAKVWEWK